MQATSTHQEEDFMQEVKHDPVAAAVNDIMNICTDVMKLYISIETKKLELAAILCNIHRFADAEGNRLSGERQFREARSLSERLLKDPIAEIPRSLFTILNVNRG